MDNIDTHHMIEKTFELRYPDSDNLPKLAKKGGRNRLAQFLGENGFNKGAEIGVRVGEFSKVLCQANPNIELYAIDCWSSNNAKRKKYYEQAKERLSPYNVRLIKKESLAAVDDFNNETLDFVYIDANHSFDFVCTDIIFWSTKVRPGGIVAGHDYYHFHQGGVVEAVQAYTKSHNISPWYVTKELEPTWFWVK